MDDGARCGDGRIRDVFFFWGRKISAVWMRSRTEWLDLNGNNEHVVSIVSEGWEGWVRKTGSRSVGMVCVLEL